MSDPRLDLQRRGESSRWRSRSPPRAEAQPLPGPQGRPVRGRRCTDRGLPSAGAARPPRRPRRWSQGAGAASARAGIRRPPRSRPSQAVRPADWPAFPTEMRCRSEHGAGAAAAAGPVGSPREVVAARGYPRRPRVPASSTSAAMPGGRCARSRCATRTTWSGSDGRPAAGTSRRRCGHPHTALTRASDRGSEPTTQSRITRSVS